MTFAIVGGGQLDTGYTIDNSLRFNDDDSAYLSRTPGGSGTTGTWTFSCWIKRGVSSTSSFYILSSGAVNQRGHIYFNSDNFIVQPFNSTGASAGRKTDAVFRDHSAWYHFLAVANGITTANLATNLDVYVNGVEFSTTATGSGTPTGGDRINDGQTKLIGQLAPIGSGNYYDGYLSEFHFIDGQALSPTDFGEFDEDSGIWKPIEYEGTYGTNGFYLDFEDSAALGDDVSGNSNDFTPTNLASTDQTIDTPTNNFCTLNPLTPVVTHTLSEGNLKSTNSSGTHGGANSTINYPTSGKWYHEVRINAEDSSKGQGVAIGSNVYRTVTQWGNYNFIIGYMSDGTKAIDTGYSSYGVAQNAGDIIGVAYNADDQELTFYHNNSSQGTIPTSEMDGTLDFDNLCPVVFGRDMGQTFNFGQDSSFAGAETRQNNTDDNGEGDFYYTPPSGYLTLNTSNLATELSPTIDDGSEYFNTVLYTGNGSTQSITGVGFQPDWTWIKRRSTTGSHALMDSSRGEDEFLESDGTAAEVTFASSNFTFTSDGYDLDYTGGYNNINQSGTTYAGWNWLANGGTTSSNTDGSITSTVQANTTAGFSIVTWTGTGANATVGHGLGVAPSMIISKNRDLGTGDWVVYHSGIGATKYLQLNQGASAGTSAIAWNNTEPTSSVFSVGTWDSGNGSGNNIVSYCFAEIEGYSKFGSYTGNGSTDGTFVYTGFRPQWIMWKRTDSTADWEILDDKINPHNEMFTTLEANTSDAEGTEADGVDMLSNGFKHRNSFNSNNASGGTYIYMAFAENPFVSSASVPVPAR